jgi:cytochrome c
MVPIDCLKKRLASWMPLLGAALLALLCLLTACGDDSQEVPEAMRLSRARGCMACHGMLHKQVGPGFAQIGERYKDDASASARLANKIRAGSVGAWGRVIMPQQTQVTEAEARLLAEWVLAQRPQPTR